MDDLIVGLGLVLVIEGLLWALFPQMARSMLEAIDDMPENTMRFIAIGAIAIGVLIVWFIRG